MKKKHLIPVAGLVSGFLIAISLVLWLADDYAMPLLGLSAFAAKVYFLALFSLVLTVRIYLILQDKDKIANFIDRWFK